MEEPLYILCGTPLRGWLNINAQKVLSQGFFERFKASGIAKTVVCSINPVMSIMESFSKSNCIFALRFFPIFSFTRLFVYCSSPSFVMYLIYFVSI